MSWKSKMKILPLVFVAIAACHHVQGIEGSDNDGSVDDCGSLGQECCASGDRCDQGLMPVRFRDEECACRQPCALSVYGAEYHGDEVGRGICSWLGGELWPDESVCINREDMERSGCALFVMIFCSTHSSAGPGACVYDPDTIPGDYAGADESRYCFAPCSIIPHVNPAVECPLESKCVVLDQEPLVAEGVCLPVESGSILGVERIVLPALVE